METLSGFLSRIDTASRASGREKPPVLIAVSKFQSVDRMIRLYEQGQRDFGENYAQELLGKSRELASRGLTDVRFHFIGKLQRNKVRSILPAVHAIHSVDSVRLLREIGRQAEALGLRVPVFFQVNLDREESKGGFALEELPELEKEIPGVPRVEPAGLMVIPDPSRPAEEAFRRLKEASLRHRAVLGPGLSMGMSSDFEAAIREGATHVRIGTALFGERRPG